MSLARRSVTAVGLASLVAAAALFHGCGEVSATPRVMVFGIDGGTWDVLEPMLAAGELPNLERLYDGGVHGILESRPPVLSPVVWSTIFTGRPHSEHGIENWKTSQSSHRKVKALWDITAERDLETRVFNVPSTWPPSPIRGVMVSGFPLSGSTVGGNTGHAVTPSELATEPLPGCYKQNIEAIRQQMSGLQPGQWGPYFEIGLRDRPSWAFRMRVLRLVGDSYYLTPCYRVDNGLEIAYPADLRARVDAALDEPYIPEGPGWSRHAEEKTPSYLFDHLVQVSRNQTRAAALFAGGPWRLFIYVHTLVDRVSHPYWAYMHPEDYEGVDRGKAELYGDAVHDAYRETDRQLGELLAATEGEFYVLIVSDHGFHSSRNRGLHIGTHDFDGTYLVAGPGIDAAAGERAFIEDVAPTALYLLELPVARDMQGSVLPGLAPMIGRSVAWIDSYEDGLREASEEPVDEATLDQIKGLGYID